MHICRLECIILYIARSYVHHPLYGFSNARLRVITSLLILLALMCQLCPQLSRYTIWLAHTVHSQYELDLFGFKKYAFNDLYD